MSKYPAKLAELREALARPMVTVFGACWQTSGPSAVWFPVTILDHGGKKIGFRTFLGSRR